MKHTLLALALVAALPAAEAAGRLTIYCSMQNEVCEKAAKRFAAEYGVETQFIRQSTGTILGKIKSEKDNPQADVWYGGTVEPHLQAADEDLLDLSVTSPKQADILPQFQKLAEQPHGRHLSLIYLMPFGIGVNTKKLAELGIEPPKCFADLKNPQYQHLIQYADPRTTGTGYTTLATLITLWGEDEAFAYLKALRPNIAEYVKSGLATKSLATGEVAVDIGFLHNYMHEKERGAPVTGILPCEGVGYGLGAVSVIKGARNRDNAVKFVDWALGVEAQELAWRETNYYQLPTNRHAKAPPQMIPAAELQLIDIDFINRFGAAKEGKRLTDKWQKEIKDGE